MLKTVVLHSPQSGHGVYTTQIDFYLIKKGSFHLSGVRLHLSIDTQKTGLDSVTLKVCKKKKFTLLVFGVNMTPHWNDWEMWEEKKNEIYFLNASKNKK